MMASLNHVVLIGRLTRNAELRYINSGIAVSKFGLAVNRRKRSGDTWVDETDFFDITAWGKTAENLNQYLVKGKEVAIEGELRQNRWEQDGQSRSRIEINAHNIQLLGSKERSADKQEAVVKKVFQDEPAFDGFKDDIPF